MAGTYGTVLVIALQYGSEFPFTFTICKSEKGQPYQAPIMNTPKKHRFGGKPYWCVWYGTVTVPLFRDTSCPSIFVVS